MTAELPRLCLITERRTAGKDRLVEKVAQARASGLEMLQLRERDLDDAAYLDLARRIREVFGGLFILNRRPQLIEKAGADGLHVGGAPRAVTEARARLGPDALVGYSAHSVEEVGEAAELGATYAFLSPIYPSISKPCIAGTLGLEPLRRPEARALPVFALGGITPERVSEVLEAGAHGVALIGAVLAGADAGARTREILEQIRRADHGLEGESTGSESGG